MKKIIILNLAFLVSTQAQAGLLTGLRQLGKVVAGKSQIAALAVSARLPERREKPALDLSNLDQEQVESYKKLVKTGAANLEKLEIAYPERAEKFATLKSELFSANITKSAEASVKISVYMGCGLKAGKVS